jgi:hypothetical protein
MEINEFEQELDDLLDRLDKVLSQDDMATLRYACGKTKQPMLREIFDDFNNIFGKKTT